MKEFLVTLFNGGSLLFVVWLGICLWNTILDLKLPRYIKLQKFLKMVNDGELFKLTAEKGLTVTCHYACNSPMVFDESEE